MALTGVSVGSLVQASTTPLAHCKPVTGLAQQTRRLDLQHRVHCRLRPKVSSRDPKLEKLVVVESSRELVIHCT